MTTNSNLSRRRFIGLSSLGAVGLITKDFIQPPKALASTVIGVPSANTLIDQALNSITDAGINGIRLFGNIKFSPSAQELADNYRKTSNIDEDAIDSIIKWRSADAAGLGFLTGLGGLTTLPVTIPANLGFSYALGANTAAAIAILRGYDVKDDRVRTFILLSLIGEASAEVVKNAAIGLGSQIAQTSINQIPGRVLININKEVGFRLITKAGETGVVNLMKLVPLVGGGVGALIDSAFVNRCGNTAKSLFVKV